MAVTTTKPAAREKRIAPTKPVTETKVTPVKKAAPKPQRRERRVTPAEAATVKVGTGKQALKPKVTQRPEVRKTTAKAKTVASTATSKVSGKKVEALNTMVASMGLLDMYGTELLPTLCKSLVQPLWPKLIDPAKAELIIMDARFASIIKGTGLPECDGKKFKLEDGDLAIAQRNEDDSLTIVSLADDMERPVAARFDKTAQKRIRFAVIPKDADKFDEYLRALGEMLEKSGITIPWAEEG